MCAHVHTELSLWRFKSYLSCWVGRGVWVGDCLQKGSGEAGSRIKGQCLGPRSFDCWGGGGH